VDKPDELKANTQPDALDPFEQQLKRSFGHVNAPENMMQFLLLAAEAEKRCQSKAPRLGKIFAFPKSPMWLGGAIAAVLVMGTLLGGEHVHRLHQREALAEKQFDTATQITDRTLEHVRQQMQRAGVQLDQ
jgi:hypothetical protein